MTRWIAAAAALTMALPVIHGAPVAPMQTNPQITTHLAVDGMPCGPVKQWQGGDMRLTGEVRANVGADKFKVSAGTATCAPVSFEIPLPAPEPVMVLIRDMCEGGSRTTTLVLSDMPLGSTTPIQALEISNAFLTEIRFKALDAGAREPLTVTLVFQGASSRTIEKGPVNDPAARLTRKVPVQALQLLIPKVDASRVSRIEAFAIVRPVVSGALGTTAGSAAPMPGQLTFPHLFATVAFPDSRGLSLWRDEAIAARSLLNRDSTLTLLDQSGAEILTMHLTGLGMVGVGVVPVADQGQRKMQAELSCEKISITVPASPPPASATPRGA